MNRLTSLVTAGALSIGAHAMVSGCAATPAPKETIMVAPDTETPEQKLARLEAKFNHQMSEDIKNIQKGVYEIFGRCFPQRLNSSCSVNFREENIHGQIRALEDFFDCEESVEASKELCEKSIQKEDKWKDDYDYSFALSLGNSSTLDYAYLVTNIHMDNIDHSITELGKKISADLQDSEAGFNVAKYISTELCGKKNPTIFGCFTALHHTLNTYKSTHPESNNACGKNPLSFGPIEGSRCLNTINETDPGTALELAKGMNKCLSLQQACITKRVKKYTME